MKSLLFSGQLLRMMMVMVMVRVMVMVMVMLMLMLMAVTINILSSSQKWPHHFCPVMVSNRPCRRT